jgi:hypothetical protein
MSNFFDMSKFNVKQFMQRLENELAKALEDTAKEILSNIQSSATHKGKKIKSTYEYKRIGKTKFVVGHKSLIAKYLEYGTKPHWIRPRNKSVLRFRKNGNWVFAKEVYHPGTRPYSSLSNAVKVARSFLKQRIARIKL